MFSGLGTVSSGTRSTISRPKPSRPPRLAGLLVMSRMVVMPRSTRIWAPMPYSRLSTGRPELEVGVDGVEALVLQVVGPQLVGDADAPALVAPQVDDHAQSLFGDRPWRVCSWCAAVAPQRAEHVAGQALAVHPDQHVVLALRRPHHEGQVGLVVEQALVGVAGELAPLGGDPGLGHPPDQLLALAAVADEVGDGDQRQAVALGEALELGQPGHAHAVLGDQLAQHAGRVQPGHAGQVDGGLGVAGPLEDAALPGPQDVDVAGTGQVAGPGGRVDQRRGWWPARSAAEMPVVVPWR